MRQVVHVIRKNDMEKEKIQTLKLELDYQLATLYDALSNQNEKEITEAKMQLTEIHRLLEELDALDWCFTFEESIKTPANRKTAGVFFFIL